jgi:hypothetical protein
MFLFQCSSRLVNQEIYLRKRGKLYFNTSYTVSLTWKVLYNITAKILKIPGTIKQGKGQESMAGKIHLSQSSLSWPEKVHQEPRNTIRKKGTKPK